MLALNRITIQPKKYRLLQRYIENLAIFLIVLSGLANILLSMPHIPGILFDLGNYYNHIYPGKMAVSLLLKRMIGFVLLVIAYHLYHRMQFAWIITIITLTCSVALNTIKLTHFFHLFIISEVFILAVLVIFRKDFSKESDRISTHKALFLASGSLFLILMNTAIGLFSLNRHYIGLNDFIDCFIGSIKLLFFMDTSVFATTQAGLVYANFSMGLNWLFIILGLFLILKPLVYDPYISKQDRLMAYHIVSKYGQNPIAYLALEEDKKYFFSSDQSGVIAFAVVGNVAVCCGDMICQDKAAPELLAEFMAFCKKNAYSIAMINVTDHYMPLYRLLGFDGTKYGEEACFKLEEYSLAGGKVAKTRAAINHATKAGIQISEYKPQVQRDRALENEINEISKEWLTLKKSGELVFMVGSVGLAEPYDRRYFVAKDVAGTIQGFVVFIPYAKGNGYLADVTRRRPHAPQGVIEKTIYEAFMLFKEEGVEWGSLGLAPLANIREEHTKAKLTTKLFEYIYENLNALYGFKQLHHAKQKYAPTHWQSRYLIYYPGKFTPKIAYAIIRVRIPNNLKNTLMPTIKKSLTKRSRTNDQ